MIYKARRPGPASWTGNIRCSVVPSHRLTCWCGCLEILKNFVFESVFCKWSLIEQWSLSMSRWDTHSRIYAIPYYLMSPEFCWGMCRSSERLKSSTTQACDIYDQVNLLLKLDFFFELEKENGVLRNTNNQGTLSYSSTLMLFIYIIQSLMLRIMT